MKPLDSGALEPDGTGVWQQWDIRADRICPKSRLFI